MEAHGFVVECFSIMTIKFIFYLVTVKSAEALSFKTSQIIYHNILHLYSLLFLFLFFFLVRSR